MLNRLPETMTAVEIKQPGGPDVLEQTVRSTPSPGAGDVLIKVAAAGVNRPDVLQRMGGYPPPPGASDLPGLEVAGEIVALGDGVSGCSPGDAVTALVTGGGYAEYCPAPVRQCLPWPEGFDAVQAAALPETFFTVWSNVFDRGGLRPGETLLTHGGTSGIGTTAIQMARAFGAHVLATAGSEAKCKACIDLGAHRAINYRAEDFVATVKQETEAGANVILDMVGGDYLARNLRCLAADGRLVQIAFLRGSRAEIDFLPLMLKRQTITGSTLRARSIEFKADIANSLRNKIWPLLSSGEIAPVIHATFPLGDAAESHRLMESGAHIGKIVLTV